MTTKQIINLTQRDLEKMTDAELRKAVSTLRSTARKRAERVKKAGVFKNGSAAVKELDRGGGLRPVATLKERSEIINEWKRYKKFLKSKTSTVKGAREYKKKLREGLKKGAGLENQTNTIFDNDEQLETFADVLDDLEESNIYELYYTKYMETLAQTIEKNPNKSKDEIASIVKERVDDWYEKLKRDNGDYGVHTSNLI